MKRIAAEIWRAGPLEVVEVVLAQTKKQAVKTTTEWNLFIGLVRRMDHEWNFLAL